MVSLHLFRSRDFFGANLLTFLLYAPLGGILFFIPLDLIQVQHYSAYRDVIWISVGMALLSALSAQMIGSKKQAVRVSS